jgi:hypothetical protein
MIRCISLPLALGLVLSCEWGGSRPAAPGAAPAAAPGEAPGAAAPAPAPGAPGQPPTQLIYPSDPAVYTKGQEIAPSTPYANGGAATHYRVSPPLPPGLNLDPDTGVISGTPSAVAPAGKYEVTGSNGAGSASVTLTLTVVDQAPGSRPVVTLAPFVTESATGLSASTPDLGKGTTYAWTLRGGSITGGQNTPAITFTAGSEGSVTAEVTVANTGGSQTGRAEATVVPRPDTTLTLPQAILAYDPSARASVAPRPGMTYQWTLTPGSATATINSGQGTSSVGLTGGGTRGTFQIQVTVTNQAGLSASATGTITVRFP